MLYNYHSSSFHLNHPFVTLLDPLKYTAISDLTESRNINIFALIETWITPSAKFCNATPLGIFLICNPRTTPTTHAHVVGGGIAFLLRDSAVIVKSSPCPVFKSFELSSVTLKPRHNKLAVYIIYRPPPTTTKTHKCVPLFVFSQCTRLFTHSLRH